MPYAKWDNSCHACAGLILAASRSSVRSTRTSTATRCSEQRGPAGRSQRDGGLRAGRRRSVKRPAAVAFAAAELARRGRRPRARRLRHRDAARARGARRSDLVDAGVRAASDPGTALRRARGAGRDGGDPGGIKGPARRLTPVAAIRAARPRSARLREESGDGDLPPADRAQPELGARGQGRLGLDPGRQRAGGRAAPPALRCARMPPSRSCRSRSSRQGLRQTHREAARVARPDARVLGGARRGAAARRADPHSGGSPALEPILWNRSTPIGVRVALLSELERRKLSPRPPELGEAPARDARLGPDRASCARWRRTRAPRSHSELVTLLASPDVLLVSAAAISLGVPGNEKAVAPLAKLLASSNERVRMSAIRGLGRIGTPSAQASSRRPPRATPTPPPAAAPARRSRGGPGRGAFMARTSRAGEAEQGRSRRVSAVLRERRREVLTFAQSSDARSDEHLLHRSDTRQI